MSPEARQPLRVLIYGAGAIGQSLGCLLAMAGHRVTLILRPRFVEAIRAQGLTVTGIHGEFHAAPERLALHSGLDALIAAHFDYAIITTKTYDTAAAITDLARLQHQNFQVMTMQNGCGNLEQVVAQFGAERSLAARVITGFEIVRPGEITITVSADATHIGGNQPGEIPAAASTIAEAINASGLPCLAVADIRHDLHAKLLYNCALNPLGAVLGVHYGALADDPDTRQLMDRIIDETFAVINALGGATHWPDAEAYRTFFYAQQVPATYHHRPSMLQDIESGKPTEVEAMTGYVAARGREHGVATPTCDFVSALVRFRERQRAAGRS